MANEKLKSDKSKIGGKHKIRPRVGDWGFILRGKGKPQNPGQGVHNKQPEN